MAHRDVREALREEREGILARLAALEVVDGEEGEREGLLRRLEEVRRSLEQASPARRSPLLRSLRIVRSCPASWSSMTGDHRVRHCSQCDREVYDLTAMMPEEVEAFLRGRRDTPCVQMHARPDGYYQDGPCLPGQRRTLRRALALAAGLGLGGLVALLSADESSVDDAVRAELAPREVTFDASAFLRGPSTAPPLERFDPGAGRVMTGALVLTASLGEGRRTGSSPSVARGDVSVVAEGGAMREPVERLFRARRAAITRCYENELRIDPDVEGEVALAVHVPSSGRVRVTAQGARHGRPLGHVAACAVRVTNGVRLVPAEEESLVVRLTLRPGH